MDDKDKIELPPLPEHENMTCYGSASMRDYAYTAILADRERRAKVDAKPVVHSGWLELFPDGSWKTRPGVDGYTGMMLNIRWTDDGRAWIESKRNREPAARLQECGWVAHGNALDGGER